MTKNVGKKTARSEGVGAFFELSALGSDVWLGVRSWKTWSSTEVLLGFSILGGSEQNSVGTYKSKNHKYE